MTKKHGINIGGVASMIIIFFFMKTTFFKEKMKEYTGIQKTKPTKIDGIPFTRREPNYMK